MSTPAPACCTDCQAMHRTPSESVRFHAQLAREFAANARRHAKRAERWSFVAFVALAVCVALLTIRSVTS